MGKAFEVFEAHGDTWNVAEVTGAHIRPASGEKLADLATGAGIDRS